MSRDGILRGFGRNSHFFQVMTALNFHYEGRRRKNCHSITCWKIDRKNDFLMLCVLKTEEEKKHAIINFLDHHQSANGSCQNKSESSTSKTKPMYLSKHCLEKNSIQLEPIIFKNLFKREGGVWIIIFCLKNFSRQIGTMRTYGLLSKTTI